MPNGNGEKSLESWIWDAACSIRGEQDAPKYKDYILPLIFVKRLCDVFDDEVERIAKKIGNKTKALKLIEKDQKIVRFFLPMRAKDIEKDDTWSVIRTLTDKVGEKLTTIMREIADHNPRIKGIIDRVDFNATTHGQRDISDDGLSRLIERISVKRLGLNDVEPDIIGRSYEYLIRKFAEGGGQSAGEFYTPKEVGMIMARILDPEPEMEVYDPCCGSAGLLIKCQLALQEKMAKEGKKKFAPLQLFGQEFIGSTWAMANMNMVIHDMQGTLEIGDTMRVPKFKDGNCLQRFDLVVANPMWNQKTFTKADYDNDELDRFPVGYPGNKADWGWMQHILASLKNSGKAAIVFGTAATSRGSNSKNSNPEKKVRKYFIDNDYVEAVILLPFNLFYNTDSPGVIFILNKEKDVKKKNKILFINATDEFYKGKPKNFLSEEGMDRIVQFYKLWKEAPGFSKILDKKIIEKNDYLLSSSKYVLKLISHEAKPLADVVPQFEEAIKHEKKVEQYIAKAISGLRKNHRKKTSNPFFGEISEEWATSPIGDFTKEYNVRAKQGNYPVLSCSKVFGIILQQEKFNYILASKEKKNYKLVEPNMFVYDPMLLWDGSIGRNSYDFKGIVSPAYSVFEVDESKINLDYLEYVFKLKIMLPYYVSISEGTNKRRRKAKFSDFQKLHIPIAPKSVQEAISALRYEHNLAKAKVKILEDLKSSYFKSAMLCETIQ